MVPTSYSCGLGRGRPQPPETHRRPGVQRRGAQARGTTSNSRSSYHVQLEVTTKASFIGGTFYGHSAPRTLIYPRHADRVTGFDTTVCGLARKCGTNSHLTWSSLRLGASSPLSPSGRQIR